MATGISKHGRIQATLAALTLAGSATTSRADDDIPGEYTGVHAVGMGDAFTAVANDDDAIWYNPAGIGRVRKARSRDTFHLTKLPNLFIGANSTSSDFYDAFKGAQEKSVEAILEANPNIGSEPFYVRGGAFPVTMFDTGRNTPMAFGIVSNTTVTALVPQATPNSAQVAAISDLGAVMTFGWNNDSNRLNLGFTARPTMRYAYEDVIPSSDLLSKTAMAKHLQNESNKATGVGLDAGMLYTLADFWYPTIGLAVMNLPTGCKAGYLNPYTQTLENVCGNVYHGSIVNPDALSTVDPTDVRAGLSITPRLQRNISVRLALDVHHIPFGTASESYGLQGIEASKMIHAGAELFFTNPLDQPMFAVRTGYNQGFMTYGCSLNLGIATLEFASYGVDVSTTAAPVEDRRYLASLSFGF